MNNDKESIKAREWKIKEKIIYELTGKKFRDMYRWLDGLFIVDTGKIKGTIIDGKFIRLNK